MNISPTVQPASSPVQQSKPNVSSRIAPFFLRLRLLLIFPPTLFFTPSSAVFVLQRGSFLALLSSLFVFFFYFQGSASFSIHRSLLKCIKWSILTSIPPPTSRVWPGWTRRAWHRPTRTSARAARPAASSTIPSGRLSAPPPAARPSRRARAAWGRCATTRAARTPQVSERLRSLEPRAVL